MLETTVQTQTTATTATRPPRQTHRAVRERWVITGQLELLTPVHFGTGEAADLVDMPVLLDEVNQQPFLPGTSIAGALRNYLREAELGDGIPFPNPMNTTQLAKERELAAVHLFGGHRGDDEGQQSPLVVYDAPGVAADFEIRDGVTINGRTRTAEEDKLFDVEMLSAGTTFDLGFELSISQPPGSGDESNAGLAYQQHRQSLLDALATALHGLSSQHIMLGSRKRRGYGQCQVRQWTVRRYDLSSPNDLLAWLTSERDQENPWCPPVAAVKTADIRAALDGASVVGEYGKQRVTLSAVFSIASSLLIRSGSGESDSGPDMVHLHSPRLGQAERVPIIPGTSWAGVLRHRAVRIANTLAQDKNVERIGTLIDDLFGPAEVKQGDKHTTASRLVVAESEITGGRSLVQTRVKIDRFTGGALESALFEQQPLFGGDGATQVRLELAIRSPRAASRLDELPAARPAEVGLLLLLLKDLWTGDLPVGGEASVGRGRLQGIEARLQVDGTKWEFTRLEGDRLRVEGNREALQGYVDAFNQEIGG